MKTTSIIILLLISQFCYCADYIVLGGKKYTKQILTDRTALVDGIYKYSYSLPEYPLRVFIVEIDLTNPDIKMETCLSSDTLYGKRATVLEMSRNKTANGHQVVAAINTDFFQFTDNKCANGMMVDGQIGQIPTIFGPIIGFEEVDNIPYLDIMRFNPDNSKVYPGIGSQKLSGINVQLEEGQTDRLILYNSLFGSYTKTNTSPIVSEAVLTLKDGETWGANKKVNCMVKKVYPNKGNTHIGPDEFVLSGFGTTYSKFISNLKEGNPIKIEVAITLENNAGISPILRQMSGSNTLALKNGDIPVITSTAGDPHANNPRSSAAYSADKKKLFLCVVDGRSSLSKGVTVPLLGEILKDLGASDGINFDGGGSSMLVAGNQIFNSPSEQRAVSQGLLAVYKGNDVSLSKIDKDRNILSVDKGTGELIIDADILQLGVKQILCFDLLGNRIGTWSANDPILLPKGTGNIYLIQLLLQSNTIRVEKVIL